MTKTTTAPRFTTLQDPAGVHRVHDARLGRVWERVYGTHAAAEGAARLLNASDAKLRNQRAWDTLFAANPDGETLCRDAVRSPACDPRKPWPAFA
jgi:hypothetical protein